MRTHRRTLCSGNVYGAGDTHRRLLVLVGARALHVLSACLPADRGRPLDRHPVRHDDAAGAQPASARRRCLSVASCCCCCCCPPQHHTSNDANGLAHCIASLVKLPLLAKTLLLCVCAGPAGARCRCSSATSWRLAQRSRCQHRCARERARACLCGCTVCVRA